MKKLLKYSLLGIFYGLLSSCLNNNTLQPADSVLQPTDSLKYQVCFIETMLLDRIAESRHRVNQVDCEKLTKNGVYERLDTIEIPNYLSLELAILPMPNYNTSDKLQEPVTALLLYNYSKKCIIFESHLITYKDNTVITIGGRHYVYNVKMPSNYAVQFEDTLRKYKDVLNPWLRQEAQRRGILK